MRLWKATVEVEVLIASEDEPLTDEIVSAAEDEIKDNGPHCCDVTFVSECESLPDVPEDWLDTLPRGDSGDQSCRAMMEAILDAREQEQMRRPMPNQKPLALD